jgi:hypothetical protein
MQVPYYPASRLTKFQFSYRTAISTTRPASHCEWVRIYKYLIPRLLSDPLKTDLYLTWVQLGSQDSERILPHSLDPSELLYLSLTSLYSLQSLGSIKIHVNVSARAYRLHSLFRKRQPASTQNESSLLTTKSVLVTIIILTLWLLLKASGLLGSASQWHAGW